MNKPIFKRTLKLNRNEHREILDALRDAESDGPDSGRHEYTMTDIPMSVEQPQGGQSHYLVYGHWLSPNGLGVLTGRYVHPGSSCLMLLTRSGGSRMLVRGKVSGCCLLSGSCHTVEVSLHEEIDPDTVEGAIATQTAPVAHATTPERKVEGSILVVEPFVPDLLLLEHHLADVGPEVRLATTPGATLDAVKRAPADLVLSGLNIAGADGIRTLERLRELKCEAPILLLTAETDTVAIDRAMRAGATGLVAKPYNVELLIAQLHVHLSGGTVPDRLLSTVARDPAMSDLVQRYVKFVRRAAEQVDRTFTEGEWFELRELCCQLKGSGVGYGFQHITVMAISALNAMERDVASAETRQAITHLIDCCRAVDFVPNARRVA